MGLLFLMTDHCAPVLFIFTARQLTRLDLHLFVSGTTALACL